VLGAGKTKKRTGRRFGVITPTTPSPSSNMSGEMKEHRNWLERRERRSDMYRHLFSFFAKSLLAAGVLMLTGTQGWSSDRVKSETIDASAMGTGTQLGQVIGITLNIYAEHLRLLHAC
jgi:hypothetical protein